MQTNATGAFNALGQTSRGWFGMATANGNVYACVTNGDIYMQSGGTGNFVAIGAGTKAWYGMAANINGNVYGSVMSGSIWMQSNQNPFVSLAITKDWRGMGKSLVDDSIYAVVNNASIWKKLSGSTTWVDQSTTSRAWSGIGGHANGNIYATTTFGDIYMQTNGTGAFVGLGKSSLNWVDIEGIGNDMYATVYNGDIYKQTNGTGAFVGLGQTARPWFTLVSSGTTIYCGTDGGDVYRSIAGGAFTATSQTSNSWRGMHVVGDSIKAFVAGGDTYKLINDKFISVGNNGSWFGGVSDSQYNVYASIPNGSLYKQTNPFTASTVITSSFTNYAGGTLKLQSGIGIGSGATSIDFVTATPLGDSNTVQTPSTKMSLNGAGNLKLTVMPTYADNASAIAGRLPTGTFYRTSTGVLMIVY